MGTVVLKTLADVVVSPSVFDSLANYVGTHPDKLRGLLVVMTRTRDDDVLTECNWAVAVKRLGEHAVVHRFGHWACGWWDALCVEAGTPGEDAGRAIAAALDAYPVLDDDAFSEAEREAADDVWRDCYSPRERIAYLRKRPGWEFCGVADMLACVRGKFAPPGLESELAG